MSGYLRLKFHVRVDVDVCNADPRILNFAIEYLCENKKFAKPFYLLIWGQGRVF